MRPDIDFAVEVLSKLSEPSVDERVRNGQRIRAQILAVLEKGGQPDSYRWQWLNQSERQLLELLQMMADDFNKAHPDDFCTVLDLMDILSVVELRLKKLLAGEKK